MNKYYEQLLNEVSYLRIDYERLNKMKDTLHKMKENLKEIRR